MASDQKRHGQTYTPEPISRALSRWAIQSADDSVLEPSVGEGRFVFDAYHRLEELGAESKETRNQIHGLDIDADAVDTLQQRAREEFGGEFPNISAGNLFDSDFPEVDALIGNPPYVIRHRFEDAEEIIERFSEYDFSDQSDLYVYFLLQATQFLKPGGRMAMIVSNSWMKRKYGEEFKEFLLNEFHIHALIGFQERVFDDLANSVCIIAEKRPNTIRIPAKNDVRFIQAESEDIFNGDEKSLDELADAAIQSARVPQRALDAGDYWDIWLRAPLVFESIKNSDDFTALSDFATPSIGVQTLHKDFYILSDSEPEVDEIEDEFLRPIAYSSRDHQDPTIRPPDCKYHVFWCSQPKDELEGTRVLEYIEAAENRTIEKRYSDETYDGLHNKTRIRKANREPWYNLIDEAERRLPSQILLPRRVYENYTAVWNADAVVPNENFLATTVERDEDVKPLLAYLNSQLGELNLRLAGQVYGGGVCDLNVSSSKTIQTLDLDALTDADRDRLTTAFDEFAETADRGVLDEAVYTILGYTDEERQEIQDALELAVEESVNKD
ncbi:Eco57I restriction-modification methylase domain-containing protein [Halomicrobium sp. LC1Hm]|uniref:Eco57I restriction-modification methylase domain-containing protein n=1 Tax=Halomicrobium sp. LC1Hm TaxID=2610902 RepID=UPI0012982FC9|nr:N-6 DNA methylase [Halomicrobium sp. LC1Hm]